MWELWCIRHFLYILSVTLFTSADFCWTNRLFHQLESEFDQLLLTALEALRKCKNQSLPYLLKLQEKMWWELGIEVQGCQRYKYNYMCNIDRCLMPKKCPAREKEGSRTCNRDIWACMLISWTKFHWIFNADKSSLLSFAWGEQSSTDWRPHNEYTWANNLTR